MNRVVLIKDKKAFIGSPKSVYALLRLKTPETLRRWIRGKKTKKARGFDVFCDVTDLDKESKR